MAMISGTPSARDVACHLYALADTSQHVVSGSASGRRFSGFAGSFG
jgi:hypothetical protein